MVDVAELLAAYDLGSWARLSDAPVARGRVGSIWRLDTERGSWALKQVAASAAVEPTEAVEGAAFQEAARGAGVPTPEVLRTVGGGLLARVGDGLVQLQGWVDLLEPDVALNPVELGRLVARLHMVPFEGRIGFDPWYVEPVTARRWREILVELETRRAPFAAALAEEVPELVALEGLLGATPRKARTCHRDLWADNLRRTATGDLCVFDFDNAGLADPSQELAQVLVEYASLDPRRAPLIHAAYREAGGPGEVERPSDFAMAIAQLAHIVEEGCRRWLIATTHDDRVDNEGWVREYLDRPLSRTLIDDLLSA